jgi:hypothetical protein
MREERERAVAEIAMSGTASDRRLSLVNWVGTWDDMYESYVFQRNLEARSNAYAVGARESSDRIFRGFGCLVIAAIITGVGYLLASAGGGVYYVFWGALAWAAWQIVTGVLGVIESRRRMTELNQEVNRFVNRQRPRR